MSQPDLDADGNVVFTPCEVCGTPCDSTALSSMGRCWSCIRAATERHKKENNPLRVDLMAAGIEKPPAIHAVTEPASEPLRYFHGGDFILNTPPDPTPLWGSGEQVLWAEGEALLIVGPQGVGKSTLGQQLALARAGITDDKLLGYPVQPAARGQRRVLYLAMDRPRQIARSMRRMVSEDQYDLLDEFLMVWSGPPLVDLAKYPAVLANMGKQVFATTIVVDSLKDAAIGLSDDEVGAGWNRARQNALQAGIELVEIHHQRKAPQGGRTTPGMDDVYGSTWITSGAGSVLLLGGSAGDPIVTMHHAKQPAEDVGPLRIIHDHDTGRSTVWHSTDLIGAASRPGGITAVDAARLLYETDKPSASQKEKARRKLTKLTTDGLLRQLSEGDRAANQAATWGSVETLT